MSVTLKTSVGDLKIELFCSQVPKTCKNFLAHCASGTYNNTLFHRNIKEFLVQGGDPTGTGKGGESIYGKYMDDEICSDLKHDRRGIVSMANRNKPNTVGSQFFITYSRQAHLNGNNTVFGRVIDGLDVLDKLERQEVDEKYRPSEPAKILEVVIHANPIADEEA